MGAIGLTSNSMAMLEKSLDFLWAKQTAHMDNISNAETPGYKVKTVTFEEAFETKIREAARAGGLRGRRMIRQAIEEASWTVDEDDEDTRMDGNGVNATEQMLEVVRTAYQTEYLYRAMSSDLSRLSRAISGNV